MSELSSYNDPPGTATLAVISKADRLNRWMHNTIRPCLKGNILDVRGGILSIGLAHHFNLAAVSGWLALSKIFCRKTLRNSKMTFSKTFVPVILFMDKLVFKRPSRQLLPSL